MDWFEIKHRAGTLLAGLKALRWSDPHQRRAIVLLTGGGIGLVLVIILAVRVLAPAMRTTDAERAAAMNADSNHDTPSRSSLEAVRDELAPRLRQDERFASLIVRPGSSAEAPRAVATVQGSVADRAAFDALLQAVDELELGDAVHLRVEITP